MIVRIYPSCHWGRFVLSATTKIIGFAAGEKTEEVEEFYLPAIRLLDMCCTTSLYGILPVLASFSRS